MTTIGGPGGIGGPKGPRGPTGPDSSDAIDGPGLDELAGDAAVDAMRGGAPPGEPGEIEQLAADVAAGRLTRHEAIDRLVESAAGPELGPSERAELRELLTDLVAHDPYLGGLIGRI